MTDPNTGIRRRREAAVSQFAESTGADTRTAAFYLQRAGYDLDTAVGAFFDNGCGDHFGAISVHLPDSWADPTNEDFEKALMEIEVFLESDPWKRTNNYPSSVISTLG